MHTHTHTHTHMKTKENYQLTIVLFSFNLISTMTTISPRPQLIILLFSFLLPAQGLQRSSRGHHVYATAQNINDILDNSVLPSLWHHFVFVPVWCGRNGPDLKHVQHFQEKPRRPTSPTLCWMMRATTSAGRLPRRAEAVIALD